MCFPRNAEEKQWKKKLFLALKDKNNERLHPIYQLQACEPFYLGSTITKQLTQSRIPLVQMNTILFLMYNSKF